MRLWAIVLSIIFAVMIINPAVADRRLAHHHPYNYHQGYKHYYGPRRHFRYDHGHFAAYVLGGLIIGGILSAVINNSYNTDTWYPNYYGQGYISPYPINNAIQPSYIKQPNGVCYVINYVINGNLVLSPVSPENCQ
ncbi:MAG: hypothetical protein KAR12_05590 [Methylococcales bacterium]|nr:hypothetical protein [Methylococcales bacterium]